MTDLYANSTEFVGSITLASAIGADETSFAFHGTIPASLRGGTSRWRVGNELVIATIDAGGTSPMMVVRGAEGSTAASHTPSTRLRHYMTAAQFRVVDGAAQKASNLSDLANAATARTNLGLGSVDNTADSAKPVSTAQQTALDLKATVTALASEASTRATGDATNASAAAAALALAQSVESTRVLREDMPMINVADAPYNASPGESRAFNDAAINQAIADASAAGGRRVFIPPTDTQYPIVTLFQQRGVLLTGEQNPAANGNVDGAGTRLEGISTAPAIQLPDSATYGYGEVGVEGLYVADALDAIYAPDGIIGATFKRISGSVVRAAVYHRGVNEQLTYEDINFTGGQYVIYLPDESSVSGGQRAYLDKTNFTRVQGTLQSENVVYHRASQFHGSGVVSWHELVTHFTAKHAVDLGGHLRSWNFYNTYIEGPGYWGSFSGSPAAPTTGSITSATNVLEVASNTGLVEGDLLVVAGAAANGYDLSTTITGIAGTTITLATNAGRTVVGAEVTKAVYSGVSYAVYDGIAPAYHTFYGLQVVEGSVARTLYSIDAKNPSNIRVYNGTASRPAYDPNLRLTQDGAGIAVRRRDSLTGISSKGRTWHAAAPPTVGGPHLAGDTVINTAPSLTKAAWGWVCTIAGSPGTWRTLGFVPERPMRVGQRYGTEGGGITAGLLTNNQMRATPFFVTETVAFNEMRCEVTAAGEAGSVIRLGVYAHDGNGPNALLYDFGTVAGDAIATAALTIAATFGPGLFWLVAVAQNAPTTPPTTRNHNGTAPMAPMPRNGVSSWYVGIASSTSVAGALPATFGGLNVNSGATMMDLKVA